MAADSNIGDECLNTGNIQQPENAGYQSPGRMGRSGRLLKGSPAQVCFGALWMRAECCHIWGLLTLLGL